MGGGGAHIPLNNDVTLRNALIGSRLSDLKYSKGKSGYNYIHVILASNRKVINQKNVHTGLGTED